MATKKATLYNEAKTLGIEFTVKYPKLTNDVISQAIERVRTKQAKAAPVEEETIISTPQALTTPVVPFIVENEAEALEAYKVIKTLGIEFTSPIDEMSREMILGAIERKQTSIAKEQSKSLTVSPIAPITDYAPEEKISKGDALLFGIVKDAEQPGKNFRFQARRALVTYKTHLNKEEVKTFFEERGAKEVITAHELGEDTEKPYPHSHVYVDFGKIFQSLKSRIFDIDGVLDGKNVTIHPHISIISSRGHLENVWSYLCKEDHENDYLKERLTVQSAFDIITSKPTLQEAMRTAKSPSEASGIALMYQLKEKEAVKLPQLAHKWQLELLDELQNTEPSHRGIIWYYDPVGGAGKSDFTKHAYVEQGAAVFTALGGDRDAGQLILTARQNGWNGKIVITDLPRDAESRSIYSPLEAIKNGMITSTKYQGGTTVIDRPHIVVFANFLPKLKGRMSWDKWDIRKLNINKSDFTVTCVPMSFHQAEKESNQTATTKTMVKNVLNSIKHEALPTITALERIVRDLQAQIASLKEETLFEEVIED